MATVMEHLRYMLDAVEARHWFHVVTPYTGGRDNVYAYVTCFATCRDELAEELTKEIQATIGQFWAKHGVTNWEEREI